MSRWLLCMALALGCVTAQADTPRLRVLGSIAYAQGGEPVISGTYTNGAAFELLAGNGWVWTVGADFRITDNISIQGSVGHQRYRLSAANADFDFQRQPVEFLGFYSLSEHVRLGAGVRKVQGAKVTGLDAGYGWQGTGDYDSSTGAVLEVQYLFSTPSMTERKLVTGLNLRFIKESYTLTDASGGTGVAKRADAMAIGLIFYY